MPLSQFVSQHKELRRLGYGSVYELTKKRTKTQWPVLLDVEKGPGGGEMAIAVAYGGGARPQPRA